MTRAVRGVAAAVWGAAGFLALLGWAVWRLGHRALEALATPLTLRHGLVFTALAAFMLYSEGYRGFQKRFAPRFAARSRHLRVAARRRDLWLAPLFCAGYYHAPPARMAAVWGLTAAIAGLVSLVRLLPQPWRGLVDGAVVLGLGWGTGALIAHLVRAHRRPPAPEAAELPAAVTAPR